jgi:type I restriction enzyme R subunit
MPETNNRNFAHYSEADTCREFVTPAIQVAGWGDHPYEIAEQHSFTDGRIVLTGRSAKRRDGKRADYLLRYRREHINAKTETNVVLAALLNKLLYH